MTPNDDLPDLSPEPAAPQETAAPVPEAATVAAPALPHTLTAAKDAAAFVAQIFADAGAPEPDPAAQAAFKKTAANSA